MTLFNSLGLAQPTLPKPKAAGSFDIGGVTAINPASDRAGDATISISGGTIGRIARGVPSNPASEYAGCFVVPGLVDMHVHLPPKNALPLTRHAMLMYLAHGVTSLREAGDLDGTAVDAARTARDSDGWPCPRVVSCGPFVGAGKPTFKNTITLTDGSDCEADAIARRVRATGATFMKFYDGLTEPMIRTLERACDKHGLAIMGHVPAALTYEQARIREVQHFFGVPRPDTLERPGLINRSCDWHAVDERRMDEIVAFTLREGIANTPTLVTNEASLSYLDFQGACARLVLRRIPPFYPDIIWHPVRGGLNSRLPQDYTKRQVSAAVSKKQQLTRKLFDAGAPLYLGTDVAQPFVLPGESLQKEMRLFAGAGIPLDAIWRLATSAAGSRLGIPKLGTIQPGAPADLLIFRKDPTLSLDHLDTLVAIVCAGRLYNKATLDETLDAFGAYFRSPIVRPLAARAAKQSMARALGRT